MATTVKVTRAQVIAAQGLMKRDRQLGRETPPEVRRLAEALSADALTELPSPQPSANGHGPQPADDVAAVDETA